MPKHALFEGLVIDENDRPVGVVMIGSEPCYVVDDSGFRRHIPSEEVDRQVLKSISESIQDTKMRWGTNRKNVGSRRSVFGCNHRKPASKPG